MKFFKNYKLLMKCFGSILWIINIYQKTTGTHYFVWKFAKLLYRIIANNPHELSVLRVQILYLYYVPAQYWHALAVNTSLFTHYNLNFSNFKIVVGTTLNDVNIVYYGFATDSILRKRLFLYKFMIMSIMILKP